MRNTKPDYKVLVIQGSGRSGTTFLAKLFDSHPDVLYRHEPDSVHVAEAIPAIPTREDEISCVNLARDYLFELLEVKDPKSSGTRPFFPKNYRSSAYSWLHYGCIYFDKAWERIPIFGSTKFSVPDLINKEQANRHVVIKSVYSLLRMKLFSLAMPEAKFIHIVRHPCAVAASAIRGAELKKMNPEIFLDTLFSLPEVAEYPFSKDYIGSRPFEEQLVFQWMVWNDKVLMDMEANPNYKFVAYEHLCENTIPVTKELFAHAQLTWHSQTQEFIERLQQTRESQTKYFSVMRPISDAIQKWKKQFTPAQVNGMLAITRHARAPLILDVVERWSR